MLNFIYVYWASQYYLFGRMNTFCLAKYCVVQSCEMCSAGSQCGTSVVPVWYQCGISVVWCSVVQCGAVWCKCCAVWWAATLQKYQLLNLQYEDGTTFQCCPSSAAFSTVDILDSLRHKMSKSHKF